MLLYYDIEIQDPEWVYKVTNRSSLFFYKCRFYKCSSAQMMTVIDMVKQYG